MSIRRIGNTKTLPPNPKWVELPRSDGDRSQWPKNTERVVDHEGCVNFMRPIDIDEAVSITWRVAAGKMIAQTLKLDGKCARCDE
ncbi:hypothetical protein PHLCEN_2v6056 [Hermanssonia centrifuga]|uniref:Uncharacterized protein n=1 Tax=Hermanssonia centrifuga TaxID=98765 RepID=A0A2R6P0T2_9APHY|nr:hypothetical protein PHLCEN_2v6056 [Hermanssonia centrifuga]